MMDELREWLLASTPLLARTPPALSSLCLLSNVLSNLKVQIFLYIEDIFDGAKICNFFFPKNKAGGQEPFGYFP